MIEQRSEALDKGALLIHNNHLDACNIAVRQAIFLLHVLNQAVTDSDGEMLVRLQDTVEDMVLPVCHRLEGAWKALLEHDSANRDRWLASRTNQYPSPDVAVDDIIANHDPETRLEIVKKLQSGVQRIVASTKVAKKGGAR